MYCMMVSVLTTVEVHEESRETRVRKEERVTEMMTVSTGQTVRTEKMMMKVIQTPQVFPVVPREIDDDWFQMFDPVPYEQRSITSGTAPYIPFNTLTLIFHFSFKYFSAYN